MNNALAYKNPNERMYWKDKEDDNILHIGVVQQIENKTNRTSNANNCSGESTEVFDYDVDDFKKLVQWFESKGAWIHYLALILESNMARRIGDTVSYTWDQFYNPNTGKMRDHLLLKEEKTGKNARPKINDFVKSAVQKYIDNTGCDPSSNDYQNPVFLQLSGNNKGEVLKKDSHYKAIKRAAKKLGIEYNVGTHSSRKFFGASSRMLHYSDNDSMEILQSIFNHSDAKTTRRYIGLTRKKVDQYYDDMGKFCEEYVYGDKKINEISEKPVVSLEAADLKELITMAYQYGLENAGNNDTMVHVNTITSILSIAEELVR